MIHLNNHISFKINCPMLVLPCDLSQPNCAGLHDSCRQWLIIIVQFPMHLDIPARLACLCATRLYYINTDDSLAIIFRYLTQKKVKIFSMALVIFYGSFIGLLILPAEGFNLPGQLGRPAEQRIPNTCQTLSGKPLNL